MYVRIPKYVHVYGMSVPVCIYVCKERVTELQFADNLAAVRTTRESMERTACILQDLLAVVKTKLM